MVINIRDARSEDFDESVRLVLEAYQEYAPALTLSDWYKMQASLSQVSTYANLASLIIAEENGNLVGSIVYYAPGKSDGFSD